MIYPFNYIKGSDLIAYQSITIANEVIGKLEKRIQYLEGSLGDSYLSIAELDRETTDLNKKIEKMEKENTGLKNLEESLNDSYLTIVQLDREVAHLNKIMEKLVKENNMLKEQVSTFMGELITLDT